MLTTIVARVVERLRTLLRHNQHERAELQQMELEMRIELARIRHRLEELEAEEAMINDELQVLETTIQDANSES